MSSIVRNEKNEVVFTIEISPEEFSRAMMEAYKKTKNRFQIPGFRKGKVPYHMVKQFYGESVFYEDAIDIVVDPAYRKAVEEHDVDVVSRPALDILEISAEKGLVYTVTVTEKPEVTLGQYTGLEASFHNHPFTDEQVDAEIQRVRERNARWIPVEDRAIEDGDKVTMDYEGFADGVAFDGGKGENHDLTIGSGQFIPGFEEQLVGHKVEEECTVDVTFPEEYHSAELAGKEASFRVKIHNVQTKELPELDDEFAKDVSTFDTLEEYKADIRKKKEEEMTESANRSFKAEVLKKAAENATVEVPDCMIEAEMDRLMESQKQMMQYQGFQMEQFLQYIGQTEAQFRETKRDQAALMVKEALTVEAVVAAENITVSEEEIEEEYKKEAAMYNVDVEKVKEVYDVKGITRAIAARKAEDLMVAQAVKVECDHEHDHDHDHGVADDADASADEAGE